MEMSRDERAMYRTALEGNPVFTDLRMERDVLKEEVAKLEAEVAKLEATVARLTHIINRLGDNV